MSALAELVERRAEMIYPDSVTVTTGLLNTLLMMACELGHRSADEQAALLVAARMLEAVGIAGGVRHVGETCSELVAEL